MQDVTITFISGPMNGQVLEYEVGNVVIGRLPPPDGLQLKSADGSVSKHHAELAEMEGGVELRNISPNGTMVDGKLVLDSVLLEPGSEVALGGNHTFLIKWQRFDRGTNTGADQVETTSAPGPLASPVIRAVIAVYLLGMVAVAVWLSSPDEDGGLAAEEWPKLRSAYEAYQDENLTEELRAQRLSRAGKLLLEIRALQAQGLDREIDPICREIMGLDSDVQSPLFQYGAKCLAQSR